MNLAGIAVALNGQQTKKTLASTAQRRTQRRRLLNVSLILASATVAHDFSGFSSEKSASTVHYSKTMTGCLYMSRSGPIRRMASRSHIHRFRQTAGQVFISGRRRMRLNLMLEITLGRICGESSSQSKSSACHIRQMNGRRGSILRLMRLMTAMLS